jgi:ABC-type protease/lipase transport system fused ATPase/permease subunit
VASRLQSSPAMMTRFDRTWEPLFVLIAFAIVFVRTL